jgi:5'-nucleotidase
MALAICQGQPTDTGYSDTPPVTQNCTCIGTCPNPTWCLGGHGNDTITCDGPGPCVIISLGGNDTVTGGNGDDLICLGSGNDTALVGPSTNTVVYGGSGADQITQKSNSNQP